MESINGMAGSINITTATLSSADIGDPGNPGEKSIRVCEYACLDKLSPEHLARSSAFETWGSGDNQRYEIDLK